MNKDKNISWVEGQDYIIFQKPDPGGFKTKCLHCNTKLKNIKYMQYDHYKHCHPLDEEKQKFKTYCLDILLRKHPKNEELSQLRKVIRFICENNVSINATQTKSFKETHNTSYSEETIRKEILAYAEELKQKTLQEIKNKYVSIVVDGATINSPGWYCVGITTNSAVYYYGCYHLAETTTRALSTKLESIIKEIEEKANAKVIGASSDNASNISNVFNPEKENSLFKLYNRHIIRVPCQAHTAQLILSSLEKELPGYSRLMSRIQNYVNYLHYETDPKMFDINTRCPPIRPQRWNTEYSGLCWVLTYAPKLRAASKNLKYDVRPCPVTKSWETLKDALAPIARYTNAVEANVLPLGKAYSFLQDTKKAIDELARKGNKYAEKIKDIIQKRWSTTADEKLMQLCHDTTGTNHMKFKSRCIMYSTIIAGPRKTAEDIETYKCMMNRLEQNVATTIKYGKMLGFDFDNAKVEITYMLQKGTKPPLSFSLVPYWEQIKMGSKENVQEAMEKFNTSIDKVTFENIAEFYHMLQYLPSSEAYCERVFKNMRELFPQQRAAAKDDLIEAQMLIKMNIKEENYRDEINEEYEVQYCRGKQDDIHDMQNTYWRKKYQDCLTTPDDDENYYE